MDAVEARAKKGGSFDVALWEAFIAADPTNRAKLAYLFPWLRPFDVNDACSWAHNYDPIQIESIERHGKTIYFAVKASQVEIIMNAVKEYEEINLSVFANWFDFISTLLRGHDAKIIEIKKA